MKGEISTRCERVFRRIITWLWRVQRIEPTRLIPIGDEVFHATATATKSPFFSRFVFRGEPFRNFRQAYKGDDEPIPSEFRRREKEELDGAIRGFAYVLATTAIVSMTVGIRPTWTFLVFFFGGVGTIVILLGVIVAGCWLLWGGRGGR